MHHEKHFSIQKGFKYKVRALKESFIEFGTRFQECSNCLLVLDTRVVIDDEHVETLFNAERYGLALYHSFVKKRLTEGKHYLYFLHKNNPRYTDFCSCEEEDYFFCCSGSQERSGTFLQAVYSDLKQERRP